MKRFLSKPLPGTFNSGLIQTVADRINRPYDLIMIPASPFNDYDKFIDIGFETNLLVIGFNDNLIYTNEQYDWWSGNKIEPNEFQFLRNILVHYPDMTVVALIPGSFWPGDYFYPLPIHLIDWAAIQENDTYPKIVPVEKDLDSPRIGISLNRQMRQHRIALISLLHGMQLQNWCHITALHLYKQLSKNPSDEFLDHNSWQFEDHHDHIKSTLCQGWKTMCDLYNRACDFQKPTPDQEAYPIGANGNVILFDNVQNFEHLRSIYEKSFVEIVACNRYAEPEVSIDEKMINSIYARNFPIVIGSFGTVEWYRSFGIDMFDDIVDHSYDKIKNPIDRLWSAIQSNRHLLEDPEQTKKNWVQCRNRFDQRINHARNELYDLFWHMTLRSCDTRISHLLSQPFAV